MAWSPSNTSAYAQVHGVSLICQLHPVEIKVRVLFFSISAKLKQIHESSEVKGFVRIDHYLSQTGNWTKWEFDANSFEQAMDEVKKLEAHMFNIPSIVNSMPCTKLFALRIVVTPNVGDAFKVAVFLELEKMLNELQVMSVSIFQVPYWFRSWQNQTLTERLERLPWKNLSWKG